jgi:hypothetical protein
MNNGIPNSQRVSACEKDVSRRFGFPLAKFAISAIWSSSPLKAVGCPNSVLQD